MKPCLFSIFVPSRGRARNLGLLIDSIMQKTKYLEMIEVFFALDTDDPFLPEYNNLFQEIKKSKFGPINFYTSVDGREEIFPNYYNRMARMACGIFFWVLNDDCVVETKDWDIIAAEKARQFYVKNGHHVWYGDVGDTTRNFNNNGEYSCFPMISSRAYRALGYFFNPQIITWGTDKFLKMVFEKSGAGIIDMTEIMVNHKRIQDDQTHTVLINRLKSKAGQEFQVDYEPDIQRLREAIAK